jgi:selenocysteine-specific elongation factor
LRRFQNLAGGGQLGAVLTALQTAGGVMKEANLRKTLGWPPADYEALKPTLIESGRIRWAAGDKVWDAQAFDELAGKVAELLQKLQGAAPWKPGWRREELGKLLGVKTGRDDGLTDLLEEQVARGEMARHGPLYCGADHHPELPAKARQQADQLLALLGADGISPRDWENALAEVAPDRKSQEILEEHLLGLGLLEKLTEKLVFAPAALEAARATLSQRAAGQPFTASEAREWLDTTRKYIIPLLEWMDQKGWTNRAGDHRVMRTA